MHSFFRARLHLPVAAFLFCHLKLLKGKKSLAINNMGDSRERDDASDMTDSIKNFIYVDVFGFCGIETVDQMLFGSATTRDVKIRLGYIEQVRELVNKHLPVMTTV